MADLERGNPFGVQKVATDNEDGSFTDADLATITAMKSRLGTIDGAYYTAARLSQMTYNDMVYALRLADNPTTVK